MQVNPPEPAPVMRTTAPSNEKRLFFWGDDCSAEFDVHTSGEGSFGSAMDEALESFARRLNIVEQRAPSN